MAKYAERLKNCRSGNLLTLLTVIGVFAGVGFGFILKISKESWTPREIMYINFLGDLFLRMLKALILPLIVASIASAIGSLDLSLLGKIGMKAIYYYGTTTIAAVILGMILVTSIRPGQVSDANNIFVQRREFASARPITTADTLLDLVRNIFPSNLVQACLAQYSTVLIPPENETLAAKKEYDTWEIDHKYTDGTNTLGLVVLAIILGITIGKMGDQGKPLLDFFNSLAATMMIITNWIIWISPIGVAFLVASKILEIKDFGAVIGTLGWYFMTVLIGLLLHGFGTLSIIYFVCTREFPFRVLAQMSQVFVTAFGTASSSATLPVTLQCLDNMGVDSRVTKFIVPIGATINMDGGALYEAVAPIFIAQVRNIPMSFSRIVGVGITATAASIGAAGIPQAGLVTLVMVLNTVGLPAEDVSLVIAIDWLLDRCRTTINVLSDVLAACIIEKISQNELEVLDNPKPIEVGELTHLNKIEA